MPSKTSTRVQLELSPVSMKRLRSLKDKTEASSYAEVTKNALKLYEHMIDLARSGDTLLVHDKKGITRELKLFF